VAQQVFNTNTAAELELPVPSISMQRKIAAILSAYDDLIENNLGRIKILEEMAQNLYREWFVKFRFPGHQKVKMVDSPLGKIPEDGWKIKRLQNLVETQYGYTASTQEEPIGPKFLRGMDINKQTFIDWAMVPYCEIEDEEYEKFKLYIGDIVVIRMADPGKVGMVEKEIEGIFASYLVRLRISSQALTPYFLFYFLLSDRYQGYIAGASTGTTRKSASAGVLVGIDMVLPPKPLLDRFESLILPIRKLIVSLIDNNTNLRRTRDLLLPKIISGELDISELDIETNNERLQN